MQKIYAKLLQISILSLSFVFLSALSTLDYTRKAEPLPNMPKGNPDLSLGIVVHENSTGIDVLRDSSQNIRYSATKNYEQTHIAELSSPSMIDKTPKKLNFIDKKYGFAADKIYQFSIAFNDENNRWEHMRFMPFPSSMEWVTEKKLNIYLDKWVKTFEVAGWKRTEYPKSDNPLHIQNFKLPREYSKAKHYCTWTTNDYKAVIEIAKRAPFNYQYYVPQAKRSKLKITPDGYMVFIHITKISQYPDFYNQKGKVEEKRVKPNKAEKAYFHHLERTEKFVNSMGDNPLTINAYITTTYSELFKKNLSFLWFPTSTLLSGTIGKKLYLAALENANSLEHTKYINMVSKTYSIGSQAVFKTIVPLFFTYDDVGMEGMEILKTSDFENPFKKEYLLTAMKNYSLLQARQFKLAKALGLSRNDPKVIEHLLLDKSNMKLAHSIAISIAQEEQQTINEIYARELVDVILAPKRMQNKG